jgi:hypothetical protein
VFAPSPQDQAELDQAKRGCFTEHWGEPVLLQKALACCGKCSESMLNYHFRSLTPKFSMNQSWISPAWHCYTRVWVICNALFVSSYKHVFCTSIISTSVLVETPFTSIYCKDMLSSKLAKDMFWVTEHHHVCWLALSPHCLLVQTIIWCRLNVVIINKQTCLIIIKIHGPKLCRLLNMYIWISTYNIQDRVQMHVICSYIICWEGAYICNSYVYIIILFYLILYILYKYYIIYTIYNILYYIYIIYYYIISYSLLLYYIYITL